MFLMHDRPIALSCDDTVTRWVDQSEQPVRRSRGYAPMPISLPGTCSRPLLAVGAELKSTFAIGFNDQAIISHHIGDLTHLGSLRAFERDIERFEQLFHIHADHCVHDLHPDYASTRYAIQRYGHRCISVQHHHAHLAACMAEHGEHEPIIGVIWDGTGYGPDGTIWGGEFLVGDYRSYQRVAHFRPVPMPGGDQAVHEPWRMAAAYLWDAECGFEFTGITAVEHEIVRVMLRKSLNCPVTSSVGRLFDAVAAMTGIRRQSNYDGQAAVELEWLAMSTAMHHAYSFDIHNRSGMVIDVRPMIRAIQHDIDEGTAPTVIARRFQTTLVAIVSAVCQRIRNDLKLNTVALSGGVFMNALLSCEVANRLAQVGFRVLRHQRVPPNDGGLALGQLAIAQALIASD